MLQLYVGTIVTFLRQRLIGVQPNGQLTATPHADADTYVSVLSICEAVVDLHSREWRCSRLQRRVNKTGLGPARSGPIKCRFVFLVQNSLVKVKELKIYGLSRPEKQQ